MNHDHNNAASWGDYTIDAVPDAVEAASDAATVATGTLLVAWTSSRINSSKLASSMRLGPVSVMYCQRPRVSDKKQIRRKVMSPKLQCMVPWYV